MKHLNLTLIFILSFCAAGLAQKQIGIPFEISQGILLGINEEKKEIDVDVLDKQNTQSEALSTLIFDDQTQFLNAEEQPITMELLSPGAQLRIEGEQINYRNKVKRLIVTSSPHGAEVSLLGIYEKYNDGVATVDGQLVKLEGNAVINGAEEWQTMTFNSFNDMMLGSFVEVKGMRKQDGIIYATGGKTYPNTYTKDDEAVRLALKENMAFPAENQLSGGQLGIGKETYRLISDMSLHEYVASIGNKLIPAYIKEIPADIPGSLSFKFYVVNNSSMNAYAFADGSVFIHTGLLEVLENEAQLAAVLGHEMAHVTHEHSRQTYEKEKGISTGKNVGRVLAKMMKKEEAIKNELSTKEALMIGSVILSNAFNRDMENQADRVGLSYMVEAGYDPREAPALWKKLADLSADTQTTASVENITDKIADYVEERDIDKDDLPAVKEEMKREAIDKAKQNATSLYGSHPAAKRRYYNLNQLVTAMYAKQDLEKLSTGEEEYQQLIVRIK